MKSWSSQHTFLVTAAVCIGVFGWMLTYGTGVLFTEDSFANFYDYQAAAFLHGRWDVPEPALGGEAFVVNGKVYGYFGPTPALLRLPLAAFGIGFGRFTRFFMLLEFVACLIAAYRIVQQAANFLLKSSPPRWTTAVLTCSAGLGSTLFYLGSRSYVYHEAILCGVAFALWSAWASLNHLRSPNGKWWVVAIALGTLSLHARPPAGLFALTFAGAVALPHLFTECRLKSAVVMLAAGGGILSFNAISYIKFGTWEGCPLRYNVQYTPERLAAIDNRNFHWSNLRFNADSYLLLPSASIRPGFPFVYLEYLNRKQYPESKIVYRDQTLAVPYSMPSLAMLATAGALAALSSASLRRPMVLLLLSAFPATLAMLTAVSVTQRYTADFCAFLIPLAAFGAVALHACGAHVRCLAAVSAIGLTIAGAGVQFATTLHNQRANVWGAPEESRREYREWRQSVDGWFRS